MNPRDPDLHRKPGSWNPGLRDDEAVTSSVLELLFSSGAQTTGFQQQETCGWDTQEILGPEKTLIGAGLQKPPTQLPTWERTWKCHILLAEPASLWASTTLKEVRDTEGPGLLARPAVSS